MCFCAWGHLRRRLAVAAMPESRRDGHGRAARAPICTRHVNTKTIIFQNFCKFGRHRCLKKNCFLLPRTVTCVTRWTVDEVARRVIRCNNACVYKYIDTGVRGRAHDSRRKSYGVFVNAVARQVRTSGDVVLRLRAHASFSVDGQTAQAALKRGRVTAYAEDCGGRPMRNTERAVRATRRFPTEAPKRERRGLSLGRWTPSSPPVLPHDPHRGPRSPPTTHEKHDRFALGVGYVRTNTSESNRFCCRRRANRSLLVNDDATFVPQQ